MLPNAVYSSEGRTRKQESGLETSRETLAQMFRNRKEMRNDKCLLPLLPKKD